MTRRILVFSLLLSGLSLQAAPSEDPSAKQREQLRSALLQVRKLQIDMANAQASQAAAEAKVTDLNTKVDSLGKRNEQLIKQASSDKVTYEQTIASLNNKLTDRDKRITQYIEALENWKTGYQKAADVARTKEQERATLLVENTELKRTVADRESKNIALFNVSTEILDHFENYSLGKALTAREPFIRKSRVTVENLVQDFKGKILDNRIGAEKPKP
jgi:chromosome segregation ATPase